MTPFEYAIYAHVNEPACRWFMPLQWAQRLMEKRLYDGKAQAPIVAGAIAVLNGVRHNHRRLFLYDWVNMPLVYTQVASACCLCPTIHTNR
jgi:hypothetical protein